MYHHSLESVLVELFILHQESFAKLGSVIIGNHQSVTKLETIMNRHIIPAHRWVCTYAYQYMGGEYAPMRMGVGYAPMRMGVAGVWRGVWRGVWG